MASDPTDQGRPVRRTTFEHQRAESQSALGWLVLLTKLWEALPPLQQTTDAAKESRLQTYVEDLAPRWPNLALVEKALKAGRIEKWKFFPSIAEIEEQCKRFEPRSMLADDRIYPLLNGPTPEKRTDGPKLVDFTRLREALKSGTAKELAEKLKASTSAPTNNS